MRNPFGRNIAGRLRLFGIAVMFPMMVLGAMLLYDYWVVMPRAAMSDAREAAAEGTHQLDDFVLRTGKVLTALAHAPQVENPQPNQLNLFLEHISRQYPEYENISFVNTEGMIVASARLSAIGVRVDDRAHIRETIETGQLAVSDVLISRANGRATIVVSYPVTDPQDGSIVGLIGVTIDLGNLPAFLPRLELKPAYRMTVFDRQGQLVFQAGSENEAADFSRCTQCHASPSPVGQPPDQTWQGNGQFHALGTSSLGWHVLVTAPADVVLGQEERNAWIVLGLVVAVLALSLLLADVTGRRLARPILKLAQAARRFGAGEQVLPLAVTTRDEVGLLTQSFNAMVKEIGEGRRRQDKQQARLHTLWELDLAISSTLSLPAVLDIVAEEMQHHGMVTGLAIYLVDEKGGLSPVMSRGTARPLVTGSGGNKLEKLASEVIQGKSPAMTDLMSDTTGTPNEPNRGEILICFAVPLASKGRALGAILFCTNNSQSFTQEEREFLYGVGLQTSTAVENARLYGSEQSRVSELEVLSEELKRQRDELQRAQEGIVETLNLALQAKDPYTRGHAERVGLLARRIASRLGMPRDKQEVLARAARLHDIGKINIPEHLLSKEGGLTPPERTQFELHPERSAELLRHLPDLDQVLPAIRGHHERWDGRGYPDGLAGGEIPLEARVIAVADSYDALTTDRPYRRGLTHDEALKVLQTYAGTQWDPEVVDVLVYSFEEEDTPGAGKRASQRPGESRSD